MDKTSHKSKDSKINVLLPFIIYSPQARIMNKKLKLKGISSRLLYNFFIFDFRDMILNTR